MGDWVGPKAGLDTVAKTENPFSALPGIEREYYANL
jgi:hypothetical protein